MTDQTAAIEVWARVLCAADAHVHGYPTWQQLPTAPGPSGRSQDDYRKVAAWLLPRMTVADPAEQAPAADRAAEWRAAADHLETLDPVEAALAGQHAWCDAAAELRRMADEAQQPETCGRTVSVSGHEYPPCARPPGHREAYCRSANGRSHFISVVATPPAAAAQQPREARS